MKQLEFTSMEAREDFETIIQDALLYCQTTASVGRCVLKEIKARGCSTMGAKAFVHILLSTAGALEDYAQRVADGQGIALCTGSMGTNGPIPFKAEAGEPEFGEGVA